MKWITLKSKNLPIVALEIDRAIEVFTGLVDRAESLGNAEDMAEVEALRQDLLIRINHLDIYYRDHSLDDNIAIFHMLKLKLEKAIFLSRRVKNKNKISSKVELFQSQGTLFHDSDVKWLDQPLFAYYQNSPKKKQSIDKKIVPPSEKSDNQHKNQKKYEKINSYKTEKEKKQLIVTSSTKINQPKTAKSTVPKKDGPHTKKPTSQIVKLRPRGSIPNISGLQTPAFGESHLNPAELLEQMGKSSQLQFTIKMTKEEYRELLQLKKQMKQPQRM